MATATGGRVRAFARRVSGWFERHLVLLTLLLVLGPPLGYGALMIVSFECQWVPLPESELQSLTASHTMADVRARFGEPSEIRDESGGTEFLYKRWWSVGFALVDFSPDGHFTGYSQDDF